MKKHIFLCLSTFAIHCVFSQSPKYRVVSIPVEKNGVQMKMPWTGGMDSPQFSAIDLNNDGVQDLFVFDRVANRVLTFINTGESGDTAFEYAPQYESLFPADLNNWAILRDFNKDGIPDIFTYVNLGMRVFKGSRLDGKLHFDLACPLVDYYDSSSQYMVNVYANIADIPLIADVDGDGDLDILSYEIFTGTNIIYYKNIAKENSGDPHYSVDSFNYVIATSCWGDFTQGATSNSIKLHANCGGGETESPQHPANTRHTGNSLYSFDADNDHDIDILNGNVTYNNLVYLQNCGDSSFANICYYDSLFPSCNTGINMPVYPAAFGFDVDNDKLEDLLIAPNVYESQGRNTHNVMHYRNTGNPLCQFEYEGDSFLVRHMIDVSSDSRPVFYDFDGDGLQDIVVGNLGYYLTPTTKQTGLAYYKNTGTPNTPQFKEVSMDYDSISRYNFLSIRPTFGDLDGDGLPDMILGEANGYIHFFKNMAVTGSSYPSLTTPQYFNIKTNLYSSPFLYDINGDSLNDLVIGRNDGGLSYFWNFGTKTVPKFSKDSMSGVFGKVNVKPVGYAFGYAEPFIMKDSAGNMKLFVGAIGGTVSVYLIDPTRLRDSSQFLLLDSNYLNGSVGERATISIADINGDGENEYLVGNALGGIMLFSDSIWDPSAVPLAVNTILKEGELHVYPNPSKDYFICAMENGNFVHPVTEVFNILGEKVNADTQLDADKITVNTIGLSNGFYIVRVTDGSNYYSGKILIER